MNDYGQLRLTRIPLRPYSSFNQFLCAYRRRHNTRGGKNLLYPCFSCSGKGKVLNPREYDDYEGWKLAGTIQCSTCNGTGSISRAMVNNIYRDEIDTWHKERTERMNRLKDERAVARKLKSTFTKAEIRILRSIL